MHWMEFIAEWKAEIYRLHLHRRTEKDNSRDLESVETGHSAQKREFEVLRCRVRYSERLHMSRKHQRHKELHQNSTLNMFFTLGNTRNRRYTSQDMFEALLLGFNRSVCFHCPDVRKVLESGECEWWQNLQLFMNTLDFQRDAWVCGGTALLESSWDRISLARTHASLTLPTKAQPNAEADRLGWKREQCENKQLRWCSEVRRVACQDFV